MSIYDKASELNNDYSLEFLHRLCVRPPVITAKPARPIMPVGKLARLGVDMTDWDYVVALAGNPNTGKSTYFQCPDRVTPTYRQLAAATVNVLRGALPMVGTATSWSICPAPIRCFLRAWMKKLRGILFFLASLT